MYPDGEYLVGLQCNDTDWMCWSNDQVIMKQSMILDFVEKVPRYKIILIVLAAPVAQEQYRRAWSVCPLRCNEDRTPVPFGHLPAVCAVPLICIDCYRLVSVEKTIDAPPKSAKRQLENERESYMRSYLVTTG